VTRLLAPFTREGQAGAAGGRAIRDLSGEKQASHRWPFRLEFSGCGAGPGGLLAPTAYHHGESALTVAEPPPVHHGRQTNRLLPGPGIPQIHTPHIGRLANAVSSSALHTTVPVCTRDGRSSYRALALRNAATGSGADRRVADPPPAGADTRQDIQLLQRGNGTTTGHPASGATSRSTSSFPGDIATPYGADLHLFDARDGSPATAPSSSAAGPTNSWKRAPADPALVLLVALTRPSSPSLSRSWMRHVRQTCCRPFPPIPAEHTFDNGDMMIRDERLAGFPGASRRSSAPGPTTTP
jgi:hypothetical protein